MPDTTLTSRRKLSARMRLRPAGRGALTWRTKEVVGPMTGNAQRGTSSAVLDNLNVPRLKKSFLQKAGCIPRTLQDQFAKLPGFLEHWRPGEPPTTQSRFDCSFANGMADEVSEYRGILLVRLGAGFVMQVRLQAQGKAVLTRTMPIAKALRIEADPPWEIASPGSLRVWSQSHSPIWQWLQGKGIQGGAPTESGARPVRARSLAGPRARSPRHRS